MSAIQKIYALLKKYKIKNEPQVRISDEEISEDYKKVPSIQKLIDKVLERKCIETRASDELIDLSDKKWHVEKIPKTSMETIVLPAGYITYKGFDGFITPENESEYMKSVGQHEVMWFGISHYALSYLLWKNGSICAYRVKKPTKLIISDRAMIEYCYKHIEAMCKKYPDKSIYGDLQLYYQICYGIDISFEDRHFMLCHMKPYGVYNPDLDTACSTPIQPGWSGCALDYTDRVYYYRTMYKMRKILYKYHTFPLLQLQFKIDGMLVLQHFNPYVNRIGIFDQEIIMLNYLEYFERDLKNPIDWLSWDASKLQLPKEIFQSGFVISSHCSGDKNFNHRMIKWFLRPEDVSANPKPKNSLRIATLNVCSFHSIEQRISEEQNIQHLVEYCKRNSLDIICLQEVKRYQLQQLITMMRQVGFGNYTRMNERFANIIFSRVHLDDVMEKVIQPQRLDIGCKHTRTVMSCNIRGLKIATTHLSIGSNDEQKNEQVRLGEVALILETDADIILGDFNEPQLSSKSLNKLTDANYVTHVEGITTPFETQVDYVFTKKSLRFKHETEIKPYKWSDHDSVIITIKDFFL